MFVLLWMLINKMCGFDVIITVIFHVNGSVLQEITVRKPNRFFSNLMDFSWVQFSSNFLVLVKNSHAIVDFSPVIFQIDWRVWNIRLFGNFSDVKQCSKCIFSYFSLHRIASHTDIEMKYSNSLHPHQFQF